jgi:hypothetical protein
MPVSGSSPAEPCLRRAPSRVSEERIAILRAQGVVAEWMQLWSHDALDAALAALLALRAHDGTATTVGCSHDGSAIWVPKTSGS